METMLAIFLLLISFVLIVLAFMAGSILGVLEVIRDNQFKQIEKCSHNKEN